MALNPPPISLAVPPIAVRIAAFRPAWPRAARKEMALTGRPMPRRVA